MIRKYGISLRAVVGTLCLLFISGIASVYAAPSPGCETLASGGSTGIFYAGDRIQMDVIVYSAGPFIPQLYYDGVSVVVGVQLNPGDQARLQYTVPANGFAEVFGILIGPGGDLDHDITFGCAVDSADSTGSSSTTNVDLSAPDERLNWRMGDEFAVMYPATASNGDQRLDVYCYVDGQGVLAFTVSEAQIASTDLSAEAVMLATAQRCNTELYLLPTGEVQLNITTPEGKLYEIICQSITCTDPILRFTDPNQ